MVSSFVRELCGIFPVVYFSDGICEYLILGVEEVDRERHNVDVLLLAIYCGYYYPLQRIV